MHLGIAWADVCAASARKMEAQARTDLVPVNIVVCSRQVYGFVEMCGSVEERKKKKEPVLRKELKEEEEIKNDWKGKGNRGTNRVARGLFKGFEADHVPDGSAADRSFDDKRNK
jgi:hypothetical protein